MHRLITILFTQAGFADYRAHKLGSEPESGEPTSLTPTLAPARPITCNWGQLSAWRAHETLVGLRISAVTGVRRMNAFSMVIPCRPGNIVYKSTGRNDTNGDS